MAVLSVVGSVFGFVHGVDNFAGASILAFSGVSYLLMWMSYFLFARRLRAAGWFAPMWVLSYIPAAILTLIEIHARAHRVQTGGHSPSLATFLGPFKSFNSWLICRLHPVHGVLRYFGIPHVIEIVEDRDCCGDDGCTRGDGQVSGWSLKARAKP